VINRPDCTDSCGLEAEQFHFVLHLPQRSELLSVIAFKLKR